MISAWDLSLAWRSGRVAPSKCWRCCSPGSCRWCWWPGWPSCSRCVSRFRSPLPCRMGAGWPCWRSTPSPRSRRSCLPRCHTCCLAASAWRCWQPCCCISMLLCLTCSPVHRRWAEATVREPFQGLARNRAHAPGDVLTDPNQHKECFMTTTALTDSRKPTQAIQRLHPLLTVLTWELRRFRASRLFWIQALCFFALLLFVLWLGRVPSGFTIAINGLVFNGFVAGTSAWGLLSLLPTGLLVLLVFLLPFVTADGVTRDLHRRTHELLMTIALPTRAYVWGRYLMGLLVSLGLALLMLAAILFMGLLLH